MSTVSEPRVYVEFDDRFDQHVRLQESHLQAEPAVWIHCEADDQGPNDPRPLLSVEQARRLRDALDLFVAEHDDAHAPADRQRPARSLAAVARQRGAAERDASCRVPGAA